MPEKLRSCLPVSLNNGPETVAFLAFAGAVSSVLVSLWLAERFMEVAIVAALWSWIRDRRLFNIRLPFLLPLGVFFAWTLAASWAAGENPVNRHTLGKFYLLVLLILAPTIIRGTGRMVWVCRSVFVVAAVASLVGLAQYAVQPDRSLMDRITGFQSTWMNYSGQLMLVMVLLCAFMFCCGPGKKWWIATLGLLIAAPLILSQTRNAWAGSAIGLVLIVLLRRALFVPVLLAALLIGYLAAPASLQQRFLSGLNPADPNTANRIELFHTSLRLIRANLWFGVGPNSVERAALRYRGTDSYPSWLYQHMHNNLLQITAERGIPGLLIWLWFMGRLAWDSWCVYRGSRRGAGGSEALLASTAALGAWAALFMAGMFEYNYGSSPVMILFLFAIGAPYAFLAPEQQRRDEGADSA